MAAVAAAAVAAGGIVFASMASLSTDKGATGVMTRSGRAATVVDTSNDMLACFS